MTTVTKIIEWDMGHRVPNHKSKCRNPHGHRYRAEITITGPVIEAKGSSDEGMVIDFGDIKQIIKTHIHDVLDHGFMVSSEDKVLMEAFDKINREDNNFHIIVVPFIPTAENICRWCYEQIKPHLQEGIKIHNIRLFETPNSWWDYQGE